MGFIAHKLLFSFDSYNLLVEGIGKKQQGRKDTLFRLYGSLHLYPKLCAYKEQTNPTNVQNNWMLFVFFFRKWHFILL